MVACNASKVSGQVYTLSRRIVSILLRASWEEWLKRQGLTTLDSLLATQKAKRHCKRKREELNSSKFSKEGRGLRFGETLQNEWKGLCCDLGSASVAAAKTGNAKPPFVKFVKPGNDLDTSTQKTELMIRVTLRELSRGIHHSPQGSQNPSVFQGSLHSSPTDVRTYSRFSRATSEYKPSFPIPDMTRREHFWQVAVE